MRLTNPSGNLALMMRAGGADIAFIARKAAKLQARNQMRQSLERVGAAVGETGKGTKIDAII